MGNFRVIHFLYLLAPKPHTHVSQNQSMPAISASAPGKVILFGEHAVVYDRPAIAVPIPQVKARTIVTANPKGTPGALHIVAPNIGLEANLGELPPDNPLAAAIHSVFTALRVQRIPACNLRISSTIPVAAGMGSGASVTVSILRALSAFLGHPLHDEQVSNLTYEVEKLHHGTPSGIDNTVITYRKPVFFIRDQPIQIIDVSQPFTLVIADTGVTSPTAITVRDVQSAWKTNYIHYEKIFDAVGRITHSAREAIESGHPEKLGPLMDKNHELLQAMDVSSPKLNHLVQAARTAGALGAKLSGGGRGGNLISLVMPNNSERVVKTLLEEGAVRTIVSVVGHI